MTNQRSPVSPLKAPFPYFGGKSRVAPVIWQHFGVPGTYIEPFFGSGATLLAAPSPAKMEIANDGDGFVANFWRAISADPEAVAHYARNCVHECDLHARNAYVVGLRSDITRLLEGDPDWYEVRVAGWWAWGACCTIGGNWGKGVGPWHVVETERGKELLKTPADKHLGKGINRSKPHISRGSGVCIPKHQASETAIIEWFTSLQNRLRCVRFCCGDFMRVLTPCAIGNRGVTAVFLDPPYGHDAGRDNAIYALEDASAAKRSRDWCLANGDNPELRICLAGYEGEHDVLEQHGWRVHAWKAVGGYSNQGKSGPGRENAKRERLWFSPHCLSSS